MSPPKYNQTHFLSFLIHNFSPWKKLAPKNFGYFCHCKKTAQAITQWTKIVPSGHPAYNNAGQFFLDLVKHSVNYVCSVKYVGKQIISALTRVSLFRKVGLMHTYIQNELFSALSCPLTRESSGRPLIMIT
jgi:hypothetical protein